VATSVLASTLEWVSALSGSIAAIAAIVTLGLAFISLRPQLAVLRRQLTEGERTQAVKVSAWAERRTSDQEGRTIVVRNSSDEPVNDCRAWLITDESLALLRRPPEARPSATWSVIPPHDELRRWLRNQKGELVDQAARSEAV